MCSEILSLRAMIHNRTSNGAFMIAYIQGS